MILRWLASRRDFSGITVARTAYYRAFYALQHTAVSLSGGRGRGSPPLEAKRGGIKVRIMNRIGRVGRALLWGQTQASRQTAMSGYGQNRTPQKAHDYISTYLLRTPLGSLHVQIYSKRRHHAVCDRRRHLITLDHKCNEYECVKRKGRSHKWGRLGLLVAGARLQKISVYTQNRFRWSLDDQRYRLRTSGFPDGNLPQREKMLRISQE